MASMEDVISRAAKKISPGRKEEAEINSVMEEIKKAVEKSIGRLSYTFAGSFTRGTWMRDKKEFDVFILFPEDEGRGTLEKKGLELGRKISRKLGADFRISYAEHPYIRANFRGFGIDIVPCFKVSDPSRLKSSVDRTPFHNQYLSTRLGQGQAIQVRLLKQFLKAGGLYGSDAKTLGFSGYLSELLILQYKSFRNLVSEAALWEAPVKVDIESHYTGVQEIKRFGGQPLVVIDPVDPKRNVAAVLSPWNFCRFADLCRQFIERPSAGFFFRKREAASLPELRKRLEPRKTLFLAVEFRKPDVIDDILYPQLRRSGKRLLNTFRENEFLVMGADSCCSEKKCYLLFEMEVWKLPAIRKVVGPGIFIRKHSREFLEKYQKARLLVEENVWTAEVRRKYLDAETMLRDILQRNPRRLMAMGIASHIAKSVKGFRILGLEEIIRLSKDPGFSRFLLEYLDASIKRPLLP